MFTDPHLNIQYAMLALLVSAAVVPFLAAKRRLAGWINFIMVTVAGLLLLAGAWQTVFVGDVDPKSALDLGVVSIPLLVDPFAAFFMAIIAFMSVMSALYCIEYMDHMKDYSLKWFYFNFPLFIMGMIAIVTFDDLTIGFTIAWQLMTIASFFLVRFESKNPENVQKANRYLFWMELAFVFIIAGALAIPGMGLTDPVDVLTEKLGAAGIGRASVVYALIFIGFAFKAGLFPLGQLWLPDAHSVAPSPVSALLSGVMIKTGVYGIMRTFFWMTPAGEAHVFNGVVWGAILAAIGAVTLFIGTAQSMKQDDAKRLLAYSSIGQVGYIALGAGAGLFLVSTGNPAVKMVALVVILGALYHVLNHAIFKGLLFLSSGSVLYATGTKDLNKLGGLLSVMPVTGFVAAIAALSISGVPPFSGFASKWSIISSSLLAGGSYLFLAIFGIIALFTSALTLSCYVKFFGMTFTAAGAEWSVKKKITEVPALMLAPKLVLVALCLVQGLFPAVYLNVLAGILGNSEGSSLAKLFNEAGLQFGTGNVFFGVQLPGAAAVPLVILIVFIVAFLVASYLRRSGGGAERTTETWLCGYQTLHNQNRYLNKNMFATLKRVLWWTGGNVK